MALLCQPGKVITTGFATHLEGVGSLFGPTNLQVKEMMRAYSVLTDLFAGALR